MSSPSGSDRALSDMLAGLGTVSRHRKAQKSATGQGQASAVSKVEATYQVAFLAHGTVAMVCAADCAIALSLRCSIRLCSDRAELKFAAQRFSYGRSGGVCVSCQKKKRGRLYCALPAKPA